MSWEDFRVFKVLADTRNIVTAAGVLDISPGTVRRHLARLEDRLGSTLFIHTPEGLSPTAAAGNLGPAVDRMSGAAEAFNRLLSADIGALAGQVRIVADELIGREFLMDLWQRLLLAHPALVLELGFEPDQEGLRSGAADIGVWIEDIEPDSPPNALRRELDVPELDSRFATEMTAGFYAHRRCLESAGAPQRIADLPRFAMIGPYEFNRLRQALDPVGLRIEDLNIVYRANSRSARIEAVRAGMGLGLIPDLVARRDPDLVRVLPEFLLRFDAWVVMRKDLADVRRMVLIRDALLEHLRGLQGAEEMTA